MGMRVEFGGGEFLPQALRGSPSKSKEALKTMKRRLKHKNPKVQLMTLNLLDACVNSLSHTFHVALSSSDIQDEFVNVSSPSGGGIEPAVQGKCLQLLSNWGSRFAPRRTELPGFQSTLVRLRGAGVAIPEPRDASGAAGAPRGGAALSSSSYSGHGSADQNPYATPMGHRRQDSSAPRVAVNLPAQLDTIESNVKLLADLLESNGGTTLKDNELVSEVRDSVSALQPTVIDLIQSMPDEPSLLRLISINEDIQKVLATYDSLLNAPPQQQQPSSSSSSSSMSSPPQASAPVAQSAPSTQPDPVSTMSTDLFGSLPAGPSPAASGFGLAGPPPTTASAPVTISKPMIKIAPPSVSSPSRRRNTPTASSGTPTFSPAPAASSPIGSAPSLMDDQSDDPFAALARRGTTPTAQITPAPAQASSPLQQSHNPFAAPINPAPVANHNPFATPTNATPAPPPVSGPPPPYTAHNPFAAPMQQQQQQQQYQQQQPMQQQLMQQQHPHTAAQQQQAMNMGGAAGAQKPVGNDLSSHDLLKDFLM